MNRSFMAAGAVVLLAAPALAQDSAAANWQKVVACAQERSEGRRHDCIDRVLEETGVLDSARRAETAAVETRENFGLSVVQQQEAARKAAAPAPVASPAPAVIPAPASPAPVQARPAAPASTPAPAPAPAKVDGLTTMVAKAFDPGNRLLVFVTAEGQIWQQNESKDLGLPPRPGTTFKVEKGAMGSYNCQFGNSRTFRCRRQG